MSYLYGDKELLAEAHELSGHKTKVETVNAALREYIERSRWQLQAWEIVGEFHRDTGCEFNC